MDEILIGHLGDERIQRNFAGSDLAKLKRLGHIAREAGLRANGGSAFKQRTAFRRKNGCVGIDRISGGQRLQRAIGAQALRKRGRSEAL